MTTIDTKVQPQKPWKKRQHSFIPANKQHAKDSLAALIISGGFILAVLPVLSILITTVIKGAPGQIGRAHV